MAMSQKLSGRLLTIGAFILAATLAAPTLAFAQDSDEQPAAQADEAADSGEAEEADAEEAGADDAEEDDADDAEEADADDAEEADADDADADDADADADAADLAAGAAAEAAAGAAADALLGGDASASNQRWIIDVSDIKFSYERFNSQGDRSEYASVQDDRVNQIDSYTLGVRVDTRLTLENDIAISYFSLLAVYRQQQVDGMEDPTEVEDIIRLELGTDIRALAVSLWNAGELMPSLAARYTTEFTPEDVIDPATAEDEEPVIVDERRRSILRGSAGLVARFDGDFEELRLSAFAERNFAAYEPYTVGGISFSGIHSHDFGPANWRNTVEADYYFPSSADTIENLRFRVGARTSLSVPIVSGLSAGVFASIYGFKGAVEETDKASYTTIIGAELGWRQRYTIPEPVAEADAE